MNSFYSTQTVVFGVKQIEIENAHNISACWDRGVGHVNNSKKPFPRNIRCEKVRALVEVLFTSSQYLMGGELSILCNKRR